MKNPKLAILTNSLVIIIISLTVIMAGCNTFNKDKSLSEKPSLTTQSNSENKTNGVFFEEKGVAIKGTDPVAYFIAQQAVKGNSQFSYQWGNTTWWFTNAKNRDLFIENPEKYAPQYGGFCAWAVSNNYTASIDPEAWTIVEGKLYLNYNKNIQKKWTKNMMDNIIKGDSNWPNIAVELQTN